MAVQQAACHLIIFTACRQPDCRVSYAVDRGGVGWGKLNQVPILACRQPKPSGKMHRPCWGCQGLCRVGQASPPVSCQQIVEGWIRHTAGGSEHVNMPRKLPSSGP